MTQFQPISTSSGEKQDPQRTFTQSSTSATVNWYNPDFYEEFAALLFNMFIPKFEYTSIEQVDPVDGWAIIGAIGGVWRELISLLRLSMSLSSRCFSGQLKFCRCHPQTICKRQASSRCLPRFGVCEHVPLLCRAFRKV